MEPIQRPEADNPDKLMLALEPEVAAIYSQHMSSIEAKSPAATIQLTPHYMVVDIGGGTVDITVHSEVDGGIHVETLPTGNCWGGTKVNEQFSHILQTIVTDEQFKKFITPDKASKRGTIINSLLYTEFEGQKILFGNCKSYEVIVDLPQDFILCYSTTCIEGGVAKLDGVTFEDDKLYLGQEFVERELFGPALENITSCIVTTLGSLDFQVGIMYLVGAFGGCKYVFERIEKQVKECQIVVPPSPNLAVVNGAVLWRKNPKNIKARRIDATYGTVVSISFDEAEHDRHYRFLNEETKCWRCNDVFDVFIEKGELATSSDVFIESGVTPSSQKLESMCFPIYTTPNIGTQYVRDKDGKYTVTQIGQLIIDIPNPDNLPREQRSVDIRMSFSGTELQASAKYSVTGNEVNTVCDFLSSHVFDM